MKNSVREILTDLKAAAIIGDPDSIFAAIDQIRAAEDEDLPPSALLPLGETLATLEPGYFVPLLGDDDAAVRGAAAAATALAWASGKPVDPEALSFVADDPAVEVRAALAQALGRTPEKAAVFVDLWLADRSDFTRQAGLQLLAQLPAPPEQTMRRLATMDDVEDHDFRSVLVDTLNAVAANGSAPAVLSLLTEWAGRPEPNTWVVARALSASWSKEHSHQAVEILNRLAKTVGQIRPILRALERHQT